MKSKQRIIYSWLFMFTSSIGNILEKPIGIVTLVLHKISPPYELEVFPFKNNKIWWIVLVLAVYGYIYITLYTLDDIC